MALCFSNWNFEKKRSKIIITSRRPLKARFTDPRVEFIALDFLNSPESIVNQIKELCADVTHAFFTSYIHDNDFSKLYEKNGPLFRNYLEAVDQACPKLQRVVLQTGGKVRCGCPRFQRLQFLIFT